MNLFWKLFVTVGIAMAITLVGAIIVSFNLTAQAFDQFDIENRDVVIERAAGALAEGGRESLGRWLERNQTPIPGIELMVFDDAGQELLDRPVPAIYERMLRARNNGQGRRRPPTNFRPPQFTANLDGPNGEVYRLLFVRTRISVLGVLSWPATQLALLILAVIAAAGTSLIIARYLSLPIERLQRATRALAAGALDTRVGKPFDERKDEVGTLARDFDAMAERIQSLVTDKEVLMRDVSHELRSPLARIRVALALAQLKANRSAQTDLVRIEQETERLDSLVGQILTWTRLRSSASDQRKRVDLAELVSEVVANAKFEYPKNEIGFSPPSGLFVTANAFELASAIENVLRNALIHSGPEGSVELKLESSAGQIVVRVLDNGPGVADQDLERIFEPFYRVDESRDHQKSGYGLGLAIAASIISRHGGQVSARNRAGGGLEISLQLPAGHAGTA